MDLREDLFADLDVGDWSVGTLGEPWAPLPSIYEHLLARVDPDTGTLSADGMRLPDDEDAFADDDLRWAPGARDGVLGHHTASGDESMRGRRIERVVLDLLDEPSGSDFARLDELIQQGPVLSVIDELVELLPKGLDGPEHPARCLALGLYLATRGGRREGVKLGIALIGLVTGDGREVPVLEVLGLHDELTLFAAVALARRVRERERTLWDMARRVNGWGRIHVIERLGPPEDAALRRWLLVEGFRNSVMYEYLAVPCARAGDLAGALEADDVDDALLLGAAEILAAQVSGQGGPAEGIDDYDDAPRAVHAYLAQVLARQPVALQHLLAADMLVELLRDDDGWGARFEKGWSQAVRQACLAACEEILARPDWPDRARATMADSDVGKAWLGDAAARVLDLDRWLILLARIRERPHVDAWWFSLVEAVDATRVDELIEVARELLPLQAIASGAGEQLGVGPEFAMHRAIEVVLSALEGHPAKGWDLVEAGLRAPVIRTRNRALGVLEAWGREKWPAAARQRLREAFAEEPHEPLRSRMAALLESET